MDGNCQTTCYNFDVTLHHFGSGSHSIQYFCNGSNMGYNRTFTGNSHVSTTYCGFPNAWVVVDGVRSNTVNFNP